MTKTCPFCAEEIPSQARLCPLCASLLVRPCAFCAEEIEATVETCPLCRSDLSSPTGEPLRRSTLAQTWVGEERGILASLFLSLVTLGIGGLVGLHRIGTELNRHAKARRLRPGRDVLLSILTIGGWTFYCMYKYPALLQEITLDEEIPPTETMVPCLLLTVMTLGLLGVMTPLPLGLLVLQSALNRHWQAHRALQAAGL